MIYRQIAGFALFFSTLAILLPTFIPAPDSISSTEITIGQEKADTAKEIFSAGEVFGDFLANSGRKVRPSRKSFGVFFGSPNEISSPEEGIGTLFPPIDFTATPQTGGIRLSWLADGRNPINGVEYSITRWAGDGSATLLTSTRNREFFDLIDCEGTPYRYRLRAIYRSASNSEAPTFRALESPAVAASATLPRRSEWSISGQTDAGEIFLTLSQPGRADSGPHRSWPGAEIGDSGWILEGLNVRETTVSTQTSIPRFDALGRRVIIDGRPAVRTRPVDQFRSLASLRLTDPCGTNLDLELLLPLSPEQP